MEEIKTELTNEELDEVSGGSRSDARHNLKNYIDCVVTGLKPGEYLYMMRTPGGVKMNVRYANGDAIKIHPKISAGYFLAYNFTTDLYGYVDCHYVK